MTPSELAPLPPSPPPRPYNSAHGRARTVVALLWAGIAVHLVAVPIEVIAIVQPQVNTDQEASESLGGALALLSQGLLGLLSVGIYIATAIVFLMWLYRSCNNLPAFGAHKRSIGYSPGWAVGSFFVPFVNLVVPYQAIKELWQKSQPQSGESLFSSTTSAPGFFPAWWGFWIASNFAGNIYFRLSLKDVPREAVFSAAVATAVLSIIAAGFAIMVVKEIDRRQEKTGQALPQAGLAGPPPPPTFSDNVKLTDAPTNSQPFNGET